MDFEYTALDLNRKRIRGISSAESISVLVSQLKQKGLIPQQIKPVQAELAGISYARKLFYAKKIHPKELAIFTRQLSSCLNAGLLLTDSMETIEEDMENFYFRNVLHDLTLSIRSGSHFSSAMVKYPKVFSDTYVAMIKAGEESGRLDKTLEFLGRYLEETERIKDKVKGALRYPIFVLGFFLLVVGIIVFFIIPKFKAMFMNAGVQLPLITRVVVGISEFMVKNVIWMIAGLIILALVFMSLSKQPKIALFFDRIKVKAPLLGKVMKKMMLSRFSWTLSLLVSGGISLITALKIGAEVNNNIYLRNIIMDIRANVTAGHAFSAEIKKQKFFPPLISKMAQVGDKTGKLSEMLQRTADYYAEEVDRSIQAMTALLEPLLIVAIGAVVLITVLALYLPIFKISSAVR
jgi:type IV pilus assembly protein PilC